MIEHLAYEHYYRHLFETYYGSLVNFACRYAHDPEEAEDIVQNVFVAMWNGRVRFESGVKMRNYLYRATIHGVYNVERHRRVCESGMAVLSQHQAQDDTLLQEAIQEHELWCRVVEAVDELPHDACRKKALTDRRGTRTFGRNGQKAEKDSDPETQGSVWNMDSAATFLIRRRASCKEGRAARSGHKKSLPEGREPGKQLFN